jgi:hypothetical protein
VETEDQQISGSSSESPPAKKLKIEKSIESPNTGESRTRNIVDKKEGKILIKKLFIVDMPDEFYSFWDLCVKLNPINPLGVYKLCT